MGCFYFLWKKLKIIKVNMNHCADRAGRGENGVDASFCIDIGAGITARSGRLNTLLLFSHCLMLLLLFRGS